MKYYVMLDREARGDEPVFDLKISELFAMQDKIQDKMKDKWLTRIPENGHFQLLYMFEEMGEIAAIIKKRGDKAIVDDEKVRSSFVEELSDTMMYFINLMACYGVSVEEFSGAFIKKHEKNMQRDFEKEHEEYLSGR